MSLPLHAASGIYIDPDNNDVILRANQASLFSWNCPHCSAYDFGSLMILCKSVMTKVSCCLQLAGSAALKYDDFVGKAWPYFPHPYTVTQFLRLHSNIG